MNKFKTIAPLIGAMLMAAMISCSKEKNEQQDGVYTPEKKIHRVYVSKDDTEKFLKEEWCWEENYLQYIDHYSGENGEWGITCREKFTYEGNRISHVELEYFHTINNNYYSNSYHSPSIYEYRNNKLNRVNFSFGYEYYCDDCGDDDSTIVVNHNRVYRFIYQNDELSKIIWNPNGNENIINLLWTGKNVTQIGEGDEYSIIEYDSKKNPFYGHFGYDPIESFYFEGQEMMVSQNNITKIYDCDGYETCTYSYLYDNDGYPIKRIKNYGYTIYYYYDINMYTYYEYE